MITRGKFILYNRSEFVQWLDQTHFYRNITLIQNHHTYLPDYAGFHSNNHFALLENMEEYHVNNNGWSEIAQNLTTFPDGTVALCRAIDKVPAGIKGANQKGICIEHVGNFDAGKDQMTPEHRNAIITINAALCRKFNLVPSINSIIYHHWYDLVTEKRIAVEGTGNAKSCPGSNFFAGNTEAAAAANFIPLIQSASLPVAAPLPSIRTGEVKAASLNVRSGPGSTFSILGQIPRGAQVTLYEEKNGWYRIHPSEHRWVSGQYV